jgi:hypothetical protein
MTRFRSRRERALDHELDLRERLRFVDASCAFPLASPATWPISDTPFHSACEA